MQVQWAMKCYLIRKGQVAILDDSKNSSDKVIATLQDGNRFGESALLAQTIRSASAVSLNKA